MGEISPQNLRTKSHTPTSEHTEGYSMKKTMLIIMIAFFVSPLFSQIIEPESYFGFKMGDDYKLAGWDTIVSYFYHLESHSDLITIEELGRSTENNPFIMAIITSRENHTNLDEIKVTARRLSDSRTLTDESARSMTKSGKIVVLITCSLHATEVGAAQMSPELAYHLVMDDTGATKNILDSVVFLLIPSFNPDGLQMVKSWYDQYVETEFEGSRMPWLYHQYVGHDNNRDAFMLTQVESRLVNRVLYHDWFPQVYLDMHQMGNSASRIFVPPFIDPLNPNTPPLIVWELGLLGQHMAMSLEAAEKSGVGNSHFFTGWWEGSFLMNAWWHNTVGLLTELASCKIATPIFQSNDDLAGSSRSFSPTTKQTNFPNPWPGGWWRLRDIVEYDFIAAHALLEASAINRETLLYNRYLMGKRSVQAGRDDMPFAFIIPENQREPGSLRQMVNLLLEGGVEVHRADGILTADGISYPEGTMIVYMEQPFRAYAKDLLETQVYPEMRQYEGGPPIQPYDVAGWTLPYQMGVKTLQVSNPLQVESRRIATLPPRTALPPASRHGYRISHRENASFIVCNRLLKKGYQIYWTRDSEGGGIQMEPGTIIIPGRQNGLGTALSEAAVGLHIVIESLSSRPKSEAFRLHPVRLGVYKPWISSMHEGWSRWVLEKYEFPYRNVHNAEIRAGDLASRYDAIYIPDIWADGILKGREKGTAPPRYAEGIGEEGLTNLRCFVEAGGILITMDSSSDMVLGDFGLPVRNVLKDVDSKAFFCPGSILKMEYNTDHPVAYGMESESIAFFARSPAFKIIPNFDTEPVAIARYPSKNLLKSGWLLGEEKLKHRAAVIDVPLGKGHVLLIGFDALNRAQAHATFKIFFNAVLYGGLEAASL